MMTNEERDKLRALVLRSFYDVNQAMPGNTEQTGVIADNVRGPKPDVDLATLYLSQRGLLNITENHGFLGTYGLPVIYVPKVTLRNPL